MKTEQYNRRQAVSYARKWAFKRNPLFYDFTGQGGNCTNFVSQCILAGACRMNYKPTFGWYYISSYNRAPAWTSVEYLYSFLTGNIGPNKVIGDGAGPFGCEVRIDELETGDVVQLAGENSDYYHTLLVSGFSNRGVLLAAQSDDAFNRPLVTYPYVKARFIHIEGVRKDGNSSDNCFDRLMNTR